MILDHSCGRDRGGEPRRGEIYNAEILCNFNVIFVHSRVRVRGRGRGRGHGRSQVIPKGWEPTIKLHAMDCLFFYNAHRLSRVNQILAQHYFKPWLGFG